MIITDVAKKLIEMTDSKSLSGAIAQVLDLKGLTKDLSSALTVQALKQKEAILDVIALEVSKFLGKLNIADEAQKVLDGATLNVQATLAFKDKRIKPITINNGSPPAQKPAPKKKTTPRRRRRS